MRIFFLMLFLTISVVGFSQDDRQPTQKEIEAQKQEAIKEAKQQVADLKEEIAEAKAKGEDPETIKEMEKQLATLENMLAMLEKTNLSGKSKSATQPVKNVEPKYISPFIPIVLKQPVSIPTEKEATDQLFWYKGKKIDANTLITTTGLIVRYDRTNHRLILQPDKKKDTTYYNLVSLLSQTPKLKNDFVDRMNGLPNNFFMYPEIQRAYEEFDFIRNRLYKTAQNTIDLPTLQSQIDLEVALGQLHGGLYQFVNNLNRQPVQQIELPPVRPNYLCDCDPNSANRLYQQALESWLPQFWGDEMQILQKIVGIYNHRHAILQKSTIYVDAQDFEEIIDKAMRTAIRRMYLKLEQLANSYKNGNIDTEGGLVWATQVLMNHLTLGMLSRSSIAFERDIALNYCKSIKSLVFSDVFDRKIKNWKASRNITEVFNYSRYLSHEYYKKDLEPSYNINENFENIWMEGLKKYNNFTLTINIKFEYKMDAGGKEPLMIATGHLESYKIAVSLGVEDCLLNLRRTDANYLDRNTDEEKFKILLKVKNGSKEYAGQNPIPYTGPSSVGMMFSRFKLNFCGNPSEVKLDLLTYSNADAQKHKGDDPKKVYTIDMLAYANKMFLGLVKTSSNVDQLIKNAGEMMNMNSANLSSSTTGNPVLDKMKADYLMNQKRYDLQYQLANATHTDKTIINLGTLNPQSSATIINPKPIDLADPNDPDKVVKMNYAFITVELIHTPK